MSALLGGLICVLSRRNRKWNQRILAGYCCLLHYLLASGAIVLEPTCFAVLSLPAYAHVCPFVYLLFAALTSLNLYTYG